MWWQLYNNKTKKHKFIEITTDKTYKSHHSIEAGFNILSINTIYFVLDCVHRYYKYKKL